MKPSNKYTVPEVLDQFKEYYEKYQRDWGPMNLVLFKANYKHADFCYEEALKTNNEDHIKMAQILVDLSPTQRQKISKLIK